MTRDEFKRGLVSAAEPWNIGVFHMDADPQDGNPVLLWQELVNGYKYADDKPVLRIPRFQLDYFTTKEYDPVNLQVAKWCREMGCSVIHDGQTFDKERNEWRNIWTVSFVEPVVS